jgi:acetyl-CoA carboxylase carboxyltransferase component
MELNRTARFQCQEFLGNHSRSNDYTTNRAAMQALVDELNARQAQARAGGGERGAAKFRAAGKLLPRERVEWLLDPNTPFLELSPLAAGGCTTASPPARRRSPASASSAASSA